MAMTLHVFSGKFASRAGACAYSEEQWEKPAPDDSWTEEAWDAYEARNPSWQLRADLDAGPLDSDFIETITEKLPMKYLETQIAKSEDFAALQAMIPGDHNTLVLIMSKAFAGRKVKLKSTPQLTYHGEFAWKL